MFTLGQAAKETGLSKPTISKAIAKGKLSAIKNPNGSYSVEPSELFRVFSPKGKSKAKSLQLETHNLHQDLQAKIEAITEERNRERYQLESTIADLRNERERLLKVIEEQTGTVKQLTTKKTESPKGWLEKLFR
jgi:predicted site-specific integrase-resolvase